jgi:hypothetical protein
MEFFKAGCWEEYFDLREEMKEETRGSFTKKRFVYRHPCPPAPGYVNSNYSKFAPYTYFAINQA